jgi:GH24 family phage-related lysozyme (muramidase)
MRSNSERLRAIQRHLGVEADGTLGPQTLGAIESALAIEFSPPRRQTGLGMCLSQRGVQLIVRHEITSDAYYRRALARPIWPGADSGVTIGIGYDLGYLDRLRFETDWSQHLHRDSLTRLGAVCGLKGPAARERLATVADITISLVWARAVFAQTTLPRYARQTRQAFPGAESLYADVQTALVSLVYNRGASMQGPTRREMRDIRNQVSNADLAAIADSISAMKRLWEGRNLAGLLRRRDEEAALVREARSSYEDSELLYL